MEKIGLVRTRDGKSFLVPFILITSLFFLWGVAHSILDVLNKHFQDTLEITRTRSALIQAVVYGGYFIMALPAGRIIRRFGYRTGVLTGLVLYGIGALLFIPGGRIQSFEFFLLALYNPQIQISAESETKRSIFRKRDKTKRSKKESAQHSKSRNKSFVMTSVSAL